MTGRLSILFSLHSLYMPNYSISHFPNLKHVSDLDNVDFSHNLWSQTSAVNNVFYLVLDNYRFTELPTLTNSDRLGKLSMNNNSLKYVGMIALFINLQSLSRNKLYYIPPNALKVSSFIFVDSQAILHTSTEHHVGHMAECVFFQKITKPPLNLPERKYVGNCRLYVGIFSFLSGWSIVTAQ